MPERRARGHPRQSSCPTAGVLMLALVAACAVHADEQLADTVARVKLSIVGIGTYSAVRRPPAQLRGTGFIVGDGRHAATNFHVIDGDLDAETREC